MSFREVQFQRPGRTQQSRARALGRRLLALAAILGTAAVIVGIVLATVGSSHTAHHAGKLAGKSAGRSGRGKDAGSGNAPATSAGTQAIPILSYHVINAAPPGVSVPDLYVPASEFTAQMQALKAAGWHAVTLDQVQAYWTRGASLGSGKPIVITFDNGYHSQYANALPVLKQLGWVGVEDLEVNGLSPSDGGLSDAEIRGLLAAGWELDTQGVSHADLIAVDSSQLQYQVATARQLLRQRYGVAVNWFCYPSGHYNATVIAAVRAAGYVGSTTVVPGWANPREDRFRLPRLSVVGGTSPTQLLSQISAAQSAAPPPDTYSGSGLA